MTLIEKRTQYYTDGGECDYTLPNGEEIIIDYAISRDESYYEDRLGTVVYNYDYDYDNYNCNIFSATQNGKKYNLTEQELQTIKETLIEESKQENYWEY